MPLWVYSPLPEGWRWPHSLPGAVPSSARPYHPAGAGGHRPRQPVGVERYPAARPPRTDMTSTWLFISDSSAVTEATQPSCLCHRWTPTATTRRSPPGPPASQGASLSSTPPTARSVGRVASWGALAWGLGCCWGRHGGGRDGWATAWRPTTAACHKRQQRLETPASMPASCKAAPLPNPPHPTPHATPPDLPPPHTDPHRRAASPPPPGSRAAALLAPLPTPTLPASGAAWALL